MSAYSEYRYRVTVDDGPLGEITEYEGELFANNGTHVVIDTSSGRVWIEKGEGIHITFEQLGEGS